MRFRMIDLSPEERERITRVLSTNIKEELRVPELGCCHIWQGAKHKGGYGKIRCGSRSQGKHAKAHRLALIVRDGDRELEVCHRCDQPLCVRPEHLFWGTHAENMRDAAGKGRCGMQRHPERAKRGDQHHMRIFPGKIAGERNGQSRLTADQANLIRRLYSRGNIGQKELAKSFGVAQTTIGRITRGVSYAS